MNSDVSIVDKVIEGFLALAFGAWAWIVRNFGKEHIDSQKEILKRQERMEEKIDRNSQRISKLEGRMESEE